MQAGWQVETDWGGSAPRPTGPAKFAPIKIGDRLNLINGDQWRNSCFLPLPWLQAIVGGCFLSSVPPRIPKAGTVHSSRKG